MEKHQIIAILGGLALSSIVGYSIYNFEGLKEEKLRILSELEESRARTTELLRQSREQRGVIESFTGQIQDIGNTVGTLEKLAATDKELLKKYSKVYFLNENYIPPALSDIEEKYIYKGSTNFEVHVKVWPYLRNLLEEAEKGDLGLSVASAYRS